MTSLVVAMRRVAVPIEGFWGLPPDIDGVGGLGVTAEVTRKPPMQSVAAENPKGDLTDDPVPRQGLRQDAHHKANHCGAAIE